MTFSEIFKKTFLEGYKAADITTLFVVTTLAITAVISCYIFLIYRLTTRKIFYSSSFNISLVATSLITASIIFTVQSSIVISLGMVGALSIVRFRTAIKDPMDLVYLFWSISVGIICGAGFAEFAVILSLVLTAVIFLLSKVIEVKSPLILVVSSKSSETEKELTNYLNEKELKYKVKSKNSNKGSFSIVIELRAPNDNTLVQDIEKMADINSVSMVEHDGEVTY